MLTKKVHQCGHGFNGKMVRITRNGQIIKFCLFCGRDIE